jgi:hypothetical protein
MPIPLGRKRPLHRGRDADFVAYYEARAATLRKTAYVLCGDWHLAEDLTQTAFTKLYQVWHRLERYEALDGYVRQTLLRAFLDDRRRPWRREYAIGPQSAVFDVPVADPAGSGEREILLAALARVVTPVSRSYTKTSRSLLLSPGTRFDAYEVKATYRPVPEIAATYSAQSFAGWPSGPPLTSVVVPVSVSRTKMSVVPLTSPGTRLLEVEAKAT